MNRGAARARAFLAGTALLLATAVLAALPASAVAAGGGVTGSVTDVFSADPVVAAGVWLWRYSPSSQRWYEYASAATGADGRYLFDGLPKGAYRLEFWTEGYYGEFYDDQWGPDVADYLFVGTSVVTADAALVPRAESLRGAVTGAGGVPLEGVLVTAYLPYLGDWIATDWSTTATDGTYTLHDLAVGSYAIEFEPNPVPPDPRQLPDPYYLAEFYSDKQSIDTASLVQVAYPAVTTGIDALLGVKVPSLRGRAIDSSTSADVPGIDVRLRSAATGAVRTARTTEEGYVFYDVPSGTYSLEFCDPDPAFGTYLTRWYRDATDSSTSDVVTLASPSQDMVLLEQHLELGVTAISGTATVAQDGTPVEGIRVTGYRYDAGTSAWIQTRWNSTGPDGTYTLDGLDTGTYRVRFDDPSGTLAQEFYQGAANLGGASDIEYVGAQVTGIDAALDFSPAVPRRLSSATRFSTAVRIALAGRPDYEGVSTVILASGDDRAAADPLAASGLCWLYDAPLLLVSASSTPAEVKVAVRDIVAVNGPVMLRVVGGPVSVPDQRLRDIKSYVEDYFGKTGLVTWGRVASTGGRYYLARTIAEEMAAKAPGRGKSLPDFALLANGADPAKFFDALALSPIAARNGAPILLVAADSVPDDTATALGSIGVNRVIIGGGPSTVDSGVADELSRRYQVERWYGRSRYETARTIADRALAGGYLSDSAVGLAAKLPDALSGGAMVGSRGGPLLLSKSDSLPGTTVDWLKVHAAGVRTCEVFGGPNSVAASVLGDIEKALKAGR